ncbi:MAG: OmpA family protein [Rhodobacteraceae bacterium]|nr:OmpA family protein [Paracoccaceae bacterium]
MRLSFLFSIAFAFVAAAALCVVAAGFAVRAVEDNTEISVRMELDQNTLDWAEVQADGLRVELTGTAPNEALRFNALSIVGGVVDAARIIDHMKVTPAAALAAPRFIAEILRNESGISIIGLIPAKTDQVQLIADLTALVAADQVTDLLETADYQVPLGWNDALDYAVVALSLLPRSKVSVEAGRVRITAVSESIEEKVKLEAKLTRRAPPGLRLSLDIAAPRPVITPFTLRYVIDDSGARFDACSAETDQSRNRIVAVARQVGLTGAAKCTVGMGVPSPNWATAATLAIRALGELGQGSVTIADADITLVADVKTSEALFDRIIGELDSALPEVFALHAILPEPENTQDIGPSEFVATLSPEGLVQLRGRLTDNSLRHMVDSYAKSRFGTDNVYTATRNVSELPPDWPVRVLAGLEALSMLTRGVVTVTADNLSVRGSSMYENTRAEMSGLLADQLGQTAAYELEITYVAPPDPVDIAPDPEVCEADIVKLQEQAKITFEPGSATIASASLVTLNAIADVLDVCGEIRLEIQGHTDSQGRETMNLQLSQGRAQSVLNQLRARRVLTSTYVATGYGETQPIADNDTEEGREANRRIVFRLIRPDDETRIREPEEPASQDTEDASAEGTDNEQN